MNGTLVLPAFRPRASAFLAAVALDALLGDPPTVVHPVGWIGRAARLLESCAPSGAPRRRRYGVVSAGALPLLAAGASWAWMRLAGRRGGAAAFVADVTALDATFALQTLLLRADEVRAALEAGDVEGARALLRRHLVSRDVDDLTPEEIAGATIESVAENLSDGVVGPWLGYAVAGLPGAFAYRAINTLDSMWGYRSERYADLGFGAANLDDAANWVPARLTALAIVAAAGALDEGARGALEVWRRDAANTESPNAGHPMAAMAGALGVVLTKRGAYTLGASGRAPVADDIARAIRVARLAAYMSAAALIVLLTRCGRAR